MRLSRHPAVAYLRLVRRRTIGCPTMQPGGIFETVLYVEDLAAAERFYRDAVGLQVIGRGDLAVVFRCGDGVLLIFDPRKSRAAGLRSPFSRSFRCRAHRVHREAGGPQRMAEAITRSWSFHRTGNGLGRRWPFVSTFAIQPVMLSSWLLQRYGVVVGSFE